MTTVKRLKEQLGLVFSLTISADDWLTMAISLDGDKNQNVHRAKLALEDATKHLHQIYEAYPDLEIGEKSP